MSKSVFDKSLYSAGDAKRLCNMADGQKTDEPFRSEFRRDYGRVIHCPSFRRLQGKTQLFPNNENDFYRNRLTHSLEVAQIAKSIALKINYEHLSGEQGVDLDMIEMAALTHDLGHPPFGHNGETALDECMRDSGGFEGNAQTFRILSRMEKKSTHTRAEDGSAIPILEGVDNRCGLNLTARSLAAILKYDKKIPHANNDRGLRKDKVFKGYYGCDEEIVIAVKCAVLDMNPTEAKQVKKFKTVECQIMDVADDIAYSTYDLEDAFKANFLDPVRLLAFENEFYEVIAAEIQADLKAEYPDRGYSGAVLEYSASDVLSTISGLFAQIFEIEPVMVEGQPVYVPFDIAGKATLRAGDFAQNGYHRTDVTSKLVGTFIKGIRFVPNKTHPALSEVFLEPEAFKIVETLKKICYKSLIMSPMLKISEYRGKDIVKSIFNTLCNEDAEGHLLLPRDYGYLFVNLSEYAQRQRVVCDYISSMTDRYALEFYNRLFGTQAQTIHKPF